MKYIKYTFVILSLLGTQAFALDATNTPIVGDNGNSFAAEAFDVDGDGDIDIYTSNASFSQNKLWINDGTGSFTANDIVGDLGDSRGVKAFDADGDGDLDLYVANYNAQNKLWINDGTGLFSANDIAGDTGHSQGVAPFDADGDGDLDLYVTNYTNQQNKLWLNDGTGSFTASDIVGDLGNSYKNIAFDADSDGDLDLYVANYGQQNKLWINDGTGLFTASDILGDLGNSYGVATGDVDYDGDLDLYVANFGGQNKLWINDGTGSFTANDIAGDIGNSFGADMADLNRDGIIDIYVVNFSGQQNKVWINDGAGNFIADDITGDLGSGLESKIADYNGDGVVDIYVANYSGEQNYLWINDEPLAAGTLTIASPAPYQTFQRGASGEADITISGSFTGSCLTIEASWNGEPYEIIDPSPTGGAFSGTLSDRSAGQGDLVVRCGNIAHVQDTHAYVGIGDVFVVAGQSNAVAQGDTQNSVTHPTLKAAAFNEDDNWIEGNDPLDNEAITGSPWPFVADHIMIREGVPVAFITTARSGTGLVAPAQWAAPGGTYYTNMIQQVTDSGVNGVKAVLWLQGETDVLNGVSRVDYNNTLDALASAINMNVAGNPIMIAAQLGYHTFGGPDVDVLDGIRLAQAEAWEDNPLIAAGPSLYDIGPLADGVHFRTDAEIDELADRWIASIDDAIYGIGKGRGPQFLSASELSNRSQIDIHFTNLQGVLTTLTLPTLIGFTIKDEGTPITVNQAVLTGSDTVRLTLTSALTGSNTSVSLGAANNRGSLLDSDTFLPAEMFLDQPVAIFEKRKSSGSRVNYICKDPTALNYNDSEFGRHKTALCDYRIAETFIRESTKDNPFAGEKCTADLIVTDNMKQGDRNGNYSSYNKGMVTQVNILQQHMNRLLFDEYGNQASGPVDGIYGPLTQRGVKRLQQRLNQLLPNMTPLVIDGIVGPFTRAAVNNSC